MEQFIFFVLTIMTLGGGVGVVTTRNLYYAALFLVTSFAGMAGYFILLNGGFLAAVQVVVYIGAIAILILFAIMLSRKIMTMDEPQASQDWWLGGIIALLLFVVLSVIVVGVQWPLSDAEPAVDVITQLGVSLLTSYLIPFEVVSVLLLVALVGGIILAREPDTE
jgi:NADH:ubiquinone oxidoreductase subunit 6 (subunit J)